MTRRSTTVIAAVLCVGAIATLVQAVEATGNSGLLGKYMLSKGPVIVPEVPEDGSAVTFNADTGTLFIAPNNPPAVMEVAPDGTYKRTITLVGFEDTEGITWISGTKYAIVQERRRVMAIADISADATSVDIAQCKTYLIDPVEYGNVGLEGVTYDAKANCFYVVKEKKPRKVYKVVLPAADQDNVAPEITHPWDLEAVNFGMSDISDVYYHAASGHLLILSDESKCLVEVTVDGKEVSRLSFAADSAGLEADVVQPEGVTLDGKGNLYIVCEPNIMYVFAPKTE